MLIRFALENKSNEILYLSVEENYDKEKRPPYFSIEEK